MKKIFFVCALFISVFVSDDVFAGPWTALEGEAVVSLAYIDSDFDKYYNLDQDKVDLPGQLEQRDTILAMSYGFYEDWEAGLQLTYFESSRRFPNNANTQTGFGDGLFRVKHLFHRGSVDLAAQVGFKWAGDYDGKLPNSPGDGQSDIEIRLLVGKFWERFYLTLEGAYRFRNGDPPDEIEASFDMGYGITSFARLRLFGRMVDASAGEGSVGTMGTILPKTEEDSVSVGGGLTFIIKKDLSLTLQYVTVVGGRNTAIRSDIGVALAYNFDIITE